MLLAIKELRLWNLGMHISLCFFFLVLFFYCFLWQRMCRLLKYFLVTRRDEKKSMSKLLDPKNPFSWLIWKKLKNIIGTLIKIFLISKHTKKNSIKKILNGPRFMFSSILIEKHHLHWTFNNTIRLTQKWERELWLKKYKFLLKFKLYLSY